jgi:hypothetical protein
MGGIQVPVQKTINHRCTPLPLLSCALTKTTRLPFNARTFPIACGWGKEDHNCVFKALRTNLDALTSSTNIVWSHHHSKWTTLRACLIAFLMDQPERRESNCLLRGNSKQHAIFGLSCKFDNLERPFPACHECLRVANRYLQANNFKDPMVLSCRRCYGFSISLLVNHGCYITPCHSKLLGETPGFTLTDKPGPLSFKMLIDAWHFAVQGLVFQKNWNKDQVYAYLSLFCINKAMITQFTLCCCNFLLVQNLKATPDKFNDTMSEYILNDQESHPHLY